MKNSIFLLVSILLLCNKAKAQFNERPIMNLETIDDHFLNWGYFLGFNQYDFKFEYEIPDNDILVIKGLGFNVGLIGEMRINEFLDLRFEPGLHYGLRTLGFPPNLIGSIDKNDIIREVKSTYINFPILLKASARRIGNWKPFIIGGVSTSLNLGSNQDNLDDNIGGDINSFRMQKKLYSYEIGFGIDFYLEYFKFSPSIRGVFAISDELVRDNDPASGYTSNIDALKTRGIFVNFTFE